MILILSPADTPATSTPALQKVEEDRNILRNSVIAHCMRPAVELFPYRVSESDCDQALSLS